MRNLDQILYKIHKKKSSRSGVKKLSLKSSRRYKKAYNLLSNIEKLQKIKIKRGSTIDFTSSS